MNPKPICFLLRVAAVIILIINTIIAIAQNNTLQPVPFTSVKLTDSFWAPRIQKNHEVTIPISIRKSQETGRIRNFVIAAGIEKGKFCSQYPFDDSDVFKIIEGAAYSLQLFPDARLESTLDSLIDFIAAAQEPDGYLYTNRTIDPENLHPFAGKNRWEKDPEHSHELYNLGHLYEAAAAHFLATGKRTLLEVAIRSANLVVHDFLDKGLKYYPGHQGIELGLVKLYRVTENPRYLDLASYFLHIREGGQEYNQAHLPVAQQHEITGHAVRATYMYSGMADVAALKNLEAYEKAIRLIWNNMMEGKYYFTGGIGSERSNEGFGPPFHLPNLTAYCETCASIGNVLWNYRMFLMDNDAKYYDVLERTLYNALLAGVSLSGDRFFYPNPLESDGSHKRAEWFGCACCPSNVCRFLPSVPGFVYATAGDRLYINLFIQNEAQPEMRDEKIHLKMETGYPWSGKVSIYILKPASGLTELAIRIPGWARGEVVPSNLYRFVNSPAQPVKLYLNGTEESIRLEKGYAVLRNHWKAGDHIELELPMQVQMAVCDDRVTENLGKAALQRGPLVYCIEWPDNPWKTDPAMESHSNFLPPIEWDRNLLPVPSPFSGLLPGTLALKGDARLITEPVSQDTLWPFVAIPYFEWANRGAGAMKVWLPLRP